MLAKMCGRSILRIYGDQMPQKYLTVALAATIVLVAVADSWGITRRDDRGDSLYAQFAEEDFVQWFGITSWHH